MNTVGMMEMRRKETSSSNSGGRAMAEEIAGEVYEASAPAAVAMKACLKLSHGDGDHLQHQRPPLLQAKLPLRLLGLPLRTRISVGQRQELALRVGASQSLELGYRFNSPDHPFNLIIKSDFGPWFSSPSAALAMAAEINLSSPASPNFRLSIKTRAGDFSFRRDFHSSLQSNLQQSIPRKKNPTAMERNAAGSDPEFTNIFASSNMQQDRQGEDRLPAYTRDLFGEGTRNRTIDRDWEHLGDTMSSSGSPSSVSQQVRNGEEAHSQDLSISNASQGWGIRSLLAGSHLCACSRLSISTQAQLNVRWRMQVPPTSSNTFPLLPVLMVDKVSVEVFGPPIIVQGTSWLSSFRKLLGNGTKGMEYTQPEAQTNGTGSTVEQKRSIDHPVQGGEVKQTPLWYLNRKRFLD